MRDHTQRAQAHKTMEWLKRAEYVKAVLLALSLIVVVYIIVTRSAEGSAAYGVKNAYVTGDVYVTGNIVYNGSIGAYPKGSILMFKASCPSGWTRYSVMDNKIPQFSSTPNGTATEAAHNHTFAHTHASSMTLASDGGIHSHSFSTFISSGGTHSHGMGYGSGLPGCPPGIYGFWLSCCENTGNGGSHSHTVSTTTSTEDDSHTPTLSGSSASAGSTVSTNSTLPLHVRTVFCKKT